MNPPMTQGLWTRLIVLLFGQEGRRHRGLVAGLLSEERGAVLVEYVAVTGFVALVSLPALMFAGVAVAKSFVFIRGYMLSPYP